MTTSIKQGYCAGRPEIQAPGSSRSALDERVEKLAGNAYRATAEDVGSSYWSAARPPESPLVFRKATNAATRSVDEVCMAELLALANEIVATGEQGKAAVTSMIRQFGMKSARAASRRRFEMAMQATIANAHW